MIHSKDFSHRQLLDHALAMPVKNSIRRFFLKIATLQLCLFPAVLLADNALAPSLNEAQKLHADGARSQQKIDQAREQTDQLLQEYRQLSEELQQLEINYQQMTEIHRQQQDSVGSLEQQLAQVSQTENDIVPMLFAMIDWLEQSVIDDLPFYEQERQERIERLKRTIVAPDLTLTERYRQVMEAYQIESEYGYTLDTHASDIKFNGEQRRVNILRTGRVGLFFESLDGHYGGRWDVPQQKWLAVDGDSLQNIKLGILIARKQRPQALLTLPLTLK